jgi:DNA gyrase/topoisomerase IV subunit B
MPLRGKILNVASAAAERLDEVGELLVLGELVLAGVFGSGGSPERDGQP